MIVRDFYFCRIWQWLSVSYENYPVSRYKNMAGLVSVSRSNCANFNSFNVPI